MKYHYNLILILSLFSFPLFSQNIQMQGNPESIISQTASIPVGYQYFFTSGFTAAPVNSELKDGDYEKYGDTQTQATSVLEKIKALLIENGYSLSDVFSMKVYVAPDYKTGEYDFAGWNKAFTQYFGTEENPMKPVRATVGIATLVNPLKFIEIEVIAAKAP